MRRRIDSVISERKYDEQYNPNAVDTEVIPIAKHQYMAALSMLDSNLPMLEVKIHAGGRGDAERAAKILAAQADDIYKYILKKIMPDSGEK